MKPELIDAVEPNWGGYPPGMAQNDFVIWQRFQPHYQIYWKRVFFNVRIGEAVMMAPDLEENMKLMVEALSRRRIDVVAETLNTWWIIELRQAAGPGALGSVLTYLALWEQDPPDGKTALPVIVTDHADINLFTAAKKFNVEIILV